MYPCPLRLAHLTAIGTLALALLSTACNSTDSTNAGRGFPGIPPRPDTKTVDVTETLHGKQIADPYRWLENQNDNTVQDWARNQQKRTEQALRQIDDRDEIRERLTALWSYERRTAPQRRGSTWLWSQQRPDQDKPALYTCTGNDPFGTDSRVLFDPNGMKNTSAGGATLSPSGTYAAVAINDSGSDWRTWKVFETATGKMLTDEIRWSKFSGAAWTHDESGFFYQRYPEPEQSAALAAPNINAKLCFHALGTAAEDDLVIYERPDEPTWGFRPQVSDDGATLIVSVWDGTDSRNRVAILDLTRGIPSNPTPKPLLWRFDAAWSYLGKVSGRTEGEQELLFVTDLNAPRQRVVAVALNKPQPTAEDEAKTAEADPDTARWQPREVVPEGALPIAGAALCGSDIYIGVLRDASHGLQRWRMDGSLSGEIALPGLGTIGGLSSPADDLRLWFTFENFVTPPTLLSVSGDRTTPVAVFTPDLPLDATNLLVQQPSFEGDDGTRLLAFLVYRQSTRLDGSNRTWLYGYGGFNISLTPRYQPDRLVWAERGGVYAQATLRGGGEFGDSWHKAGMLQEKQNVFNDLYATASYLVRNDYTSPEHLGVNGRSNGGLLAAVAMTQRPDLFGAAVPEVGVLDMLRYHLFTIGAAWIPEYGDPRDADAFAWLQAYSPLHNIKPGIDYPATMVMTSDHDDRVVPAHSFKFAATLQASDTQNPALLRVTTSAGHGGGSPRSTRIQEATDRIAFLEWALGE